MSKNRTGVTKKTLHRFILDAGAVYINWGEKDERLLGATRGGNTFTVEQEVKETEIDGARGQVAGTRRVITVTPSLTANLLEVTAENIQLALAGSVAINSDETGTPGESGGTHKTITRTANVMLENHVKNIALLAPTSGGKDGIFMIKNGLADGNLELGTEDKNEAVIETQFTGHFDPADLTEEPWAIIWPNEPVDPEGSD